MRCQKKTRNMKLASMQDFFLLHKFHPKHTDDLSTQERAVKDDLASHLDLQSISVLHP